MAAREKIISIKNGSVEMTNELFRPVGRTNENKATRLNFDFDAQFLTLTGKRVVFRSAAGVLLDPVDILTETVGTETVCYVEIPFECLDAVGSMSFSVYGDDADGRVFATKSQQLSVDEALKPTGGTPYATYVSIVSSAISARDSALASASAADAAALSANEAASLAESATAIKLTQAEYELIVPDPSKIYFIVG